MARKTGQIIRRGPATWLVRIYVGRDSETGDAYTLARPFKEVFALRRLISTVCLASGDLGRNIRSSKQTLSQYLDHWLDICARPRLRTKSFRGLLELARALRLPLDWVRGHSGRFLQRRFRLCIVSCSIESCRPAPFVTRMRSFSLHCARLFVGTSSSLTPQNRLTSSASN